MNTVIVGVICFLAGALTSYLALRNNPAIKAKVDTATAAVAADLGKK